MRRGGVRTSEGQRGVAAANQGCDKHALRRKERPNSGEAPICGPQVRVQGDSTVSAARMQRQGRAAGDGRAQVGRPPRRHTTTHLRVALLALPGPRAAPVAAIPPGAVVKHLSGGGGECGAPPSEAEPGATGRAAKLQCPATAAARHRAGRHTRRPGVWLARAAPPDPRAWLTARQRRQWGRGKLRVPCEPRRTSGDSSGVSSRYVTAGTLRRGRTFPIAA